MAMMLGASVRFKFFGLYPRVKNGGRRDVLSLFVSTCGLFYRTPLSLHRLHRPEESLPPPVESPFCRDPSPSPSSRHLLPSPPAAGPCTRLAKYFIFCSPHMDDDEWKSRKFKCYSFQVCEKRTRKKKRKRAFGPMAGACKSC